MFDLSNHVALVTGGNGGLGLAMAKGLAKAGADIAIWGRDQAKNEVAVDELRQLGAKTEAFVCDVTNPEACQASFAATLEKFGKVDSCFANAGGSGPMGIGMVRGPSRPVPKSDDHYPVLT